MLDLNLVTHVYRWKGAAVPHVTGIIGAVLGDQFANIPARVLEHKRQIGQAVHLACHYDDAGELDEASVHPEAKPYLEAWRAFRRESGCEVLLSEQQFYHPTYGYAGTLDRVVRLNGTCAIVDIKTGLPGPLAGLQTAAYAEMVDAHMGWDGGLRRFALRALPSTRYKFEEYTHVGDWRDFLACLAVHRLKERIANE